MTKILKVVGASWLRTKVSSYILGILGILAILALFAGQIERSQEDGTYAATVYYSEKTGYRIEYWGQSNELADIPKGAARAYFRMDVETTGWSLLEVETEESYPDEIQAYAAGIVEGALTWSLIHSHLENTIRAKCENKPLEKQCNKLRDALDKSVDIWKSYAAERGNTDPYWHQVSLYYTQIGGIFTGWKHGVERSQSTYDTDLSDLYWLNSAAEVIEIQRKLNISLGNDVIDTLPDLSSGFIRIVNETANDGTLSKKLHLAQNTAGSYSSMTRILKRYKLNYHMTSNKNSSLVPGVTVDFSSYPGSVNSQDEFYVIQGKDHRIAVSGTPLRNYNSKLWKEVNITEQVPVGPRVLAANHLAHNVSSWGHILASNNSGTGCKQWLVVDFNKFDQLHDFNPEDKMKLKNDIVSESTVSRDVKHTLLYRTSNGHGKGLVWLIEQVPGRTHSADLSDVLLEQGYWATHGLPFFKDITEATHIDKMIEQYGNIFSETESPRAVLFKRGYKNATSLDSIIKLMRQNNVTAMNRASNVTEPCREGMDCMLSEMGYWAVLGARGDLVQQYNEAYGIIDTKVVTGTRGKSRMEFVALSGPPYTKPVATKVNKGNIAPIYTHQFDNDPTIDGLEIRDLVQQQLEKAEQRNLEYLNRDVIKPFQWSESEYVNTTHKGLSDKWAFEPFELKWSW